MVISWKDCNNIIQHTKRSGVSILHRCPCTLFLVDLTDVFSTADLEMVNDGKISPDPVSVLEIS